MDLVHSFAEPWSLSIALAVSGAQPDDAPHLTRLAREVFLAAAHATRLLGRAAAPLAAASELARALARDASGTASADVQTFVALTQTLPCTLAAALARAVPTCRWRRVAACAASTGFLEPSRTLLRLTGPSRAVFRTAMSALEIGEARVGAGDRVVLMLSAANRDPAKYVDPDHFDVHRDTSGHLAFGRGAHACSGAALIREAIAIGTRALLDATSLLELAGDVEWLDGFAIRGPTSLGASLHRST